MDIERRAFLKVIRIFAMVIPALLLTPSVEAHSTAGRIKVPLEKERLEVDDLAYFVEPYVNQEKYRGQFEQFKNRFAVREFDRVVQHGSRAEIFFKVLDFKEKDRTFPDSMGFGRDGEGRWFYTGEDGERQPVFTYVGKNRYYIEKYAFQASAVGFVLSIAFLMVLRRSRRSREQAEKEKG